MPDHAPPAPDSLLRLQAVEAAAETLRRGMPAVLTGSASWVVLAVETADEVSRARLAQLSMGAPVLVVSGARAAALPGVGPGPIAAVALEPGNAHWDDIEALADPTRPATGFLPIPTDLPEAAAAALALAVLARLLPAVLMAPAARSGVPAADVLQHARLSAANLVRVSEAPVPLEDMADARLVAFRTPGSGLEQYAILIGRPEAVAAPLVRVHSECFTGDLLGSLRCDCGDQLRGAVRRMAAEGAGALLYMAQEGRGIGLANKLRAYTLQDRGLDTLDANRALGFAADERDFLAAATMLHQLGLRRVRVLTNNPEKLAALSSHGIEVVGRASLLFAANGVNDQYLRTKATRFGHLPG